MDHTWASFDNSFQFGSCKINFKAWFQGAVESVSIGEVNISLSQSLMKLEIHAFSKDPKIHAQVCDLEVVMRESTKGSQKNKTKKSRSGKSKGKLMLVAKIARFISVSVTDLNVKVKIDTVEIPRIVTSVARFIKDN